MIFIGVFVLCLNYNKIQAQNFIRSMDTINFDRAERLYEYGKIDDSFQVYINLAKLASEREDYVTEANALYEVSQLFRRQNNYFDALKYMKWADTISNRSSDSILRVRSQVALANSYIRFYKDDRYDSLALIKYMDSASIVIQNATEFANQVKSNNHLDQKELDRINKLIGDAYSGFSSVYFNNEEDYTNSRAYAQMALNLFEESKDTTKMAFAYNQIGNTYIILEDWENALIYYETALALLDKYPYGAYMQERADISANYAWALRLKGDPEAFDYLEQVMDIESSLLNEETNRMLSEVEQKHNVARAVEKIEEENRKQEEEKKNFRVIAIMMAVLSVFLIGTIFSLYKSTQMKHKYLELQIDREQLSKNAELERLEREGQTKVLNATMDARETERKSIAELLHDSVSSLLSSANLHLQAAKTESGSR